jgi:hypothetical protein
MWSALPMWGFRGPARFITEQRRRAFHRSHWHFACVVRQVALGASRCQGIADWSGQTLAVHCGSFVLLG